MNHLAQAGRGRPAPQRRDHHRRGGLVAGRGPRPVHSESPAAPALHRHQQVHELRGVRQGLPRAAPERIRRGVVRQTRRFQTIRPGHPGRLRHPQGRQGALPAGVPGRAERAGLRSDGQGGQVPRSPRDHHGGPAAARCIGADLPPWVRGRLPPRRKGPSGRHPQPQAAGRRPGGPAGAHHPLRAAARRNGGDHRLGPGGPLLRLPPGAQGHSLHHLRGAAGARRDAARRDPLPPPAAGGARPRNRGHHQPRGRDPDRHRPGPGRHHRRPLRRGLQGGLPGAGRPQGDRARRSGRTRRRGAPGGGLPARGQPHGHDLGRPAGRHHRRGQRRHRRVALGRPPRGRGGDHRLPPHPHGNAGLGGGDPGGGSRGRQDHLSRRAPGNPHPGRPGERPALHPHGADRAGFLRPPAAGAHPGQRIRDRMRPDHPGHRAAAGPVLPGGDHRPHLLALGHGGGRRRLLCHRTAGGVRRRRSPDRPLGGDRRRGRRQGGGRIHSALRRGPRHGRGAGAGQERTPALPARAPERAPAGAGAHARAAGGGAPGEFQGSGARLR